MCILHFSVTKELKENQLYNLTLIANSDIKKRMSESPKSVNFASDVIIKEDDSNLASNIPLKEENPQEQPNNTVSEKPSTLKVSKEDFESTYKGIKSLVT